MGMAVNIDNQLEQVRAQSYFYLLGLIPSIYMHSSISFRWITIFIISCLQKKTVKLALHFSANLILMNMVGLKSKI